MVAGIPLDDGSVIDLLEKEGPSTVTFISSRLGYSSNTVRRSLTRLEVAGRVERLPLSRRMAYKDWNRYDRVQTSDKWKIAETSKEVTHEADGKAAGRTAVDS